MKPTGQEVIHLDIPLILVKDGEYFIVSCDALSIYSQSKESDKAVEGFVASVKKFFDLLEGKGRESFANFLYSKNIVTAHFKEIEVSEVPELNLELGHYTNWHIPAKARPQQLEYAY